MSAKQKFRPDWAIHPGEHVKEYLETRNISQAELARMAGMTPKLVSEIIHGRNPVTPRTALALEKALGLRAEIWLGIQNRWDLRRIRQERENHSGMARHA